MHLHFQDVHSHPWKMALLKHFKCIEPSKEERIQSVLLKPDGSLVHLIPSSAIEAVNSITHELLITNGTIDEDSQRFISNCSHE